MPIFLFISLISCLSRELSTKCIPLYGVEWIYYLNCSWRGACIYTSGMCILSDRIWTSPTPQPNAVYLIDSRRSYSSPRRYRYSLSSLMLDRSCDRSLHIMLPRYLRYRSSMYRTIELHVVLYPLTCSALVGRA